MTLLMKRALTVVLPVLLSTVLVLSCGTAGVAVIDGDTIRLASGEVVRYIGIDTAERGEPYYWEATRANRLMLEGKALRLESDVTNEDRYGRLLRYVYANDIFVNAELVRQGLALVYREGKFPDNKYFEVLRQASEEAAAEGLGIWSLGMSHPKITKNPTDYFLPTTLGT
jgi:endonuclease YncB( thermonuclease family)